MVRKEPLEIVLDGYLEFDDVIKIIEIHKNSYLIRS
jgi:hypothetical protein